MVEKMIISGPVIIQDGKLLLIKDDDDNLYKVPGGEVESGESLEEACKREVKEEINGDIILLRKLSTLTVNKPDLVIELHHFLAELKNKNIKPGFEVKEIKWLDIKGIKQGKYNVATNIKYLIKMGDIK
jgi:8-oxo-dGTP diphosphatase